MNVNVWIYAIINLKYRQKGAKRKQIASISLITI